MRVVKYALRSQATLLQNLYVMTLPELIAAYNLETAVSGKRRKSLINLLSARIHRVERRKERTALNRIAPKNQPRKAVRGTA